MPTKKQPAPKLKTLADMPEVTFVTSGIKEIDAAIGGFPRSRITEISGMQGVGKTHLVSKCLSEMSKSVKVLYIDAEAALNPDRLKALGANPKNVHIVEEYQLEEVAELVISHINTYDVIVVDSVAALIPKSEQEGQTGDQFIGLRARLMGQWMRKLVGPLGKSKTALILINQLRESPGLFVQKYTPGGNAVRFAASLRLELSTNQKARKQRPDGSYEGHTVYAKVTKTKFSAPHTNVAFFLQY